MPAIGLLKTSELRKTSPARLPATRRKPSARKDREQMNAYSAPRMTITLNSLMPTSVIFWPKVSSDHGVTSGLNSTSHPSVAGVSAFFFVARSVDDIRVLGSALCSCARTSGLKARRTGMVIRVSWVYMVYL